MYKRQGGTDHLTDLGITHLHLLPAFDHRSIDETNLDEAQFNWGYDPQNYNVPEGSYSTDPENGEVRINEFKQMVQSLHQNGVRVVMDLSLIHISTNPDIIQIADKWHFLKNLLDVVKETISSRFPKGWFIIPECPVLETTDNETDIATTNEESTVSHESLSEKEMCIRDSHNIELIEGSSFFLI